MEGGTKMKFEKPATKQSQIAACAITPFKARVVTACWNQYLLAV